MRVSLIKSEIVKDLILPKEITGSFWLTDFDENGNEKKILNIEATQDGWVANSNNDVFCILNDKRVDALILRDYNFYLLKDRNDSSFMILYCSPVNDPKFQLYQVDSMVNGITIGSDNRADIFYSSEFVAPFHARISLLSLEANYNPSMKNRLIIKEEDEKYKVKSNRWGVYVNNKRVHKQQILDNNDTIFIMGLKVIISKLGNKYLCAVNKPNDTVRIKGFTPVQRSMNSNQNEEVIDDSEDIEMELYKSSDYFYKKPRFVNKLETLELSVDAPPAKEEDPNTSLILTIGPMLTMSMTSLVMGYSAINNVTNNNGSWNNAIPSIVICVAMFASILIWPAITKKYEGKRRRKKEKERQAKYSKYIEEKRKVIQNEVARQEKVMRYSFPSVLACEQIILQKTDRLWERRVEDEDFLTVCLGVGNQDMKINIKYPEEHFSMVEDNLKDIVNKLGSEPKTLQNVPIELSLKEYKLLAIVGEDKNNSKLMKQILLQLVALHSYDDLKIVILTNKEKESNWDKFKIAPHLFSDDKSIRYFGAVSEEHKEICYSLEQIYLSRKPNSEEFSTPKTHTPHYLIITDSFKSVRGLELIKSLLDEKEDLGFNLIILNDTVGNLPDQCQTFINSREDQGDLFKSSLNNKVQPFAINNIDFDYTTCIKTISNMPIEIDRNKAGKLPDKVSFLQMYEAYKIDQLNVANRWQKNNPVLSLGAPVGYGRDGDIISLDLHEKYHGPHGLIAGMTGSGKSEFIITYILSMAINYHPDEVQFILIDYKGGGLAGAFENKAANIKLPHVVGTITNLDSVEIKRSFASIESELKRRQAAFNKARDLSGESTIDIYKYQKMYREKTIDEPVSHLFIICDEFAELKNQEPEFMDQLISTARIGRSLGVHLILATQKPSGVVDPQIWSNTRFRVCLRVQEKSDSSEVIKCPDAAFLKHTGRFYFQVGFNEIFELGQAAWAGGPYIPSNKPVKIIDTSVEFINNLGYTYKSNDNKKVQEKVVAEGEELTNIVNYISSLAITQKINCRPLWLERIPEQIFVDNLIKKYNYQKEPFNINPIIGEYDNPNMQSQHLLTMPLTKEGNALIYGAAGSGKENMITTLLYSSMLYYTPKEVNYYILDFGSESLKVFNKCPIVGDVLLSSDEEKIENLYKMLFSTIEQRKKLFSDFGGDFTTYNQNSKESLPSIVVIINNYEAYQELQEAYDEDLIVLTRDCVKYGIYFIITVTTPNGIRFKLKQNFNHEYVLGQNSEDDYTTILGSVNKTYPSKLFGRGIIKTDQVYEFQTALVTEKEKIIEFINEKNKVLSQSLNEKAPSIKVLPETVTYEDIKEEIDNPLGLVVGINKNTLLPELYNFKQSSVNIITGMDTTLSYNLLDSLINQLIYRKEKQVFINAEDFDYNPNYSKYVTYSDSDFDIIFEKLYNHVLKYYTEYEKNNFNKKSIELPEPIFVLINGITTLKNKLKEENKSKLGDLFQKASDLGIMNFIIIESIDNIRKLEIEQWYKNTVNTSNGIWIGNGINDQFSLRITQKTKDITSNIEDNFCIVLKRGKPVLVKMLEDFKVKL